MGKRRTARELALQALFFMDMAGDDSDEKLHMFMKSRAMPKKTPPLFLELVKGVTGARREIDRVIERFSSNWKIDRMSGVDRNVLRISVYEILCREDIPVKVSINEAIDIGKKYGTEDSGAFINGILDSIHLASDKENLCIELPSSVTRSPAPAVAAESKTESASPSDPAPFAPVKGKSGVVKRKSRSQL